MAKDHVSARRWGMETPFHWTVFFIIFMLLYLTFHSVSEASIVMLSVVYAMTGGVVLRR